jgi:toxin ParE1/3/4
LKRVDLSELAEGDLADIWVEIARDHIENADRFLDAVRERMQLLAEQPLIGRERPEFGTGARSVPHGEYLIIYRPTAAGVGVARVVHGRRDLSRIRMPSE